MKRLFAIFAVAALAVMTFASGPPAKAFNLAVESPAKSFPISIDLPPIEFNRPQAPPGTPPTKFEGIWDFRDISAVVSHRVTGLTEIFGIRGLNAEARGFGGLNISEHNAPTVGGALVFDVKVAKEVRGSLGFGGQLTQKNSIRFILYGGLTIPIGN